VSEVEHCFFVQIDGLGSLVQAMTIDGFASLNAPMRGCPVVRTNHAPSERITSATRRTAMITIFDTPLETSAASSIHEQVLHLLDRTQYRRITTAEDLAAIGRLRYQAFESKGVFTQKLNGLDTLIDACDTEPHAMTFGVDIDGELVATIRMHVLNRAWRTSSAMEAFAGVLNPLLDQGSVLTEPNRLAVNFERAPKLPGLLHVVFRLAVMHTCYQEAVASVAAMKTQHAAFYRRIFGSTIVSGPIKHPVYNQEGVLLSTDPATFDRLYRRYPSYRFLDAEAALLFAPDHALSVSPTARAAIEQQAAPTPTGVGMAA
jgi:hypothetical protein